MGTDMKSFNGMDFHIEDRHMPEMPRRTKSSSEHRTPANSGQRRDDYKHGDLDDSLRDLRFVCFTRQLRSETRRLLGADMKVLVLIGLMTATAGTALAQVPPDIEEGLRKIGQIVDPACTAKLYRPLMPKNDYNTYCPVGAPRPAQLH